MTTLTGASTASLPTPYLLRRYTLTRERPPNFQLFAKAKSNGVFMSVKARFGSSGGGASVLERPKFDQSQFDPSTQVLEGGDIGQLRDKRGVGNGDSYRVLLLHDARHSENLVVKILPQVVPSVTPDDARRLFYESRENGLAVVIVTVKEHAEFYVQMMIRGGLRSTMEPDSNTA